MNNTTLIDPRKVLVGIMLSDGTEHVMFSFPSGNPSNFTLHAIVALIADGWRLEKAETVSANELKR
jgi:hypothetical protein